MDQPLLDEAAAASQSSSSGCVGRSPVPPKLLGVPTRPSSEDAHARCGSAITRAVSGFCGAAIAFGQFQPAAALRESRPAPRVKRLARKTTGSDRRRGCYGPPRIWILRCPPAAEPRRYLQIMDIAPERLFQPVQFGAAGSARHICRRSASTARTARLSTRPNRSFPVSAR